MIVQGSVGALEGVLVCPIDDTEVQSVAVICHPHPLHGGTMQNKVVHYIAKTLNEMGIASLRFNFRGVGASEGEYAEGQGETDDLLAVIDFIQARYPEARIVLAGFSFGAYVALKASVKEGVTQLILVAPPVHLFDFTQLSLPDCPCLLIQGEADEIVNCQDVVAWAQACQPLPNIVLLPEVSHFFHGRLNLLREHLLENLSDQL